MKIGISISGGGYRATTYSLGAFSYLNHLQLNDQPLLQSVEALSTVSGGSITGITYALSVKRGQSFDDYFTTIYNFITEYDLVSDAIQNFVQTNTKPSLIEGIATSYANQLFKDLRPDTDETFRTNPRFDAITPALKKDSITEYDSHLKFVCINATDFNTGTPFRFIAKCPSVKADFVFGNSFHIVSKEIEKVPLKIAMAASSCFPGGFEPIMFDLKNRVNNIEEKVTKDFQFEVLNNPQKYKELSVEELKIAEEKYFQQHTQVSLMDGGIVDNQGIDSILMYNQSLSSKITPKDNNKSTKKIGKTADNQEDKPNAIEQKINANQSWLDLLMVIDVASPSMDSYNEDSSTNIPVVGNVKLILIHNVIQVLNIIGFGAIYYGITYDNMAVSILSTLITTILSIITTVMYVGKYKIRNVAQTNAIGIGDIERMNDLTLNSVLTLAKNRLSSVSLLVGTVFMKHLRRKNIESIYQDPTLKYRSIVNSLYQLKNDTPRDKYLKMRFLSIPERYAQPTPLIRSICDKAFSMGTTLWVSKDDKGKALVQSVIVAGQITTCANLLVHLQSIICKDSNCKKCADEGHTTRIHMDRLLKDVDFDNKTPIIKEKIQLYFKVLDDWNRFIEDPYWLLKKQGVPIISLKNN